MQQSVAFLDVDFDDLLHGMSANSLLQPATAFLWQLLFSLREQLISGFGEGPQITGRVTSSNAYTRMQIDNMYSFVLNSSLHFT